MLLTPAKGNIGRTADASHHGSVLPLLLLQVIPSRDHAVINRCSSMMTFLLDKLQGSVMPKALWHMHVWGGLGVTQSRRS